MGVLRGVLAALVLVLGSAEAARCVTAPAPGGAPETSSQRLESLLPRRCGVCHLDRAPAAPAGVVVFSPPPEASAAGAAGMCFSCHDGLVRDDRRSLWTGRHHPARGQGVDCGSCHTPHVREQRAGAFLRYESGTFGWCGKCHGGRRPGVAGEHPAVALESGRRFDCGSCHVLHGASGAGLVRSENAVAICTGCHGENPSRDGRGPGKETHPGAPRGPGCLDCHHVHGGGAQMLGKDASEGRICTSCHEKLASPSTGGSNHPVGGARATCASCHRTHNAGKKAASGGPLLVAAAAEIDQLCARCHADHAGSDDRVWNHPLAVKGGDQGTVDGARLRRAGALFGAGGRITCLSCHRSHGGVSGTPQLFAPAQAACLFCHPGQNALDPERATAGAHPLAVRPRRARIAEVFRENGGAVGARGELLCTTCHRAHRAQPGTPGMVVGTDVFSCLLCHSEQAAVAGTPHSTARPPGNVARGAGGVCAGCHGAHGWRVPIAPASDPEDPSSAVERLCRACHGAPKGAPFGGATNHPLNVSLPPGTAGALPLFWRDGRRLRNGVLTCPTCHDPHRSGAAGAFLRTGPEGRDLCLGCHGAQEAVAGTKHDLAGGRGLICAVCHPVHDPAAPLTWPRLRGDTAVANLDLSAFCTRCHRKDGPAAGAIVTERGHPVAAPAAPEGPKPVGCAGCHDAHRWNPADAADRGRGADASAATAFLRRPVSGGGGLCEDCHPAQTAVAGTPHDLTGVAALPEGMPDPTRAGVCGSCHRVHGGDPVLLLSAPLVAGRGGGGRGDPCEACHTPGGMAAAAPSGERTHPVGVSPGFDPGPDLPLYAPTGRRQSGGRMACGTCHDPHRLAPVGGSGAPTPAAASFLRVGADGFAPLCFPCHAEQSMVVGTDHDLRVTAPASVNAAGGSPEASGVCGACHAVHGAPNSFVLWGRALDEGVDVVSRACRSCHRPGNATAARVPRRLEFHEVRNPGRPPEPRIFKVTRFSREGPGPVLLFKPDGSRGEQGYLSCASCHDVHRWESGVMSSGGGVPLEGDVDSSFLRAPSTLIAERSICRECHPHNAAELYRRYHFPEGP